MALESTDIHWHDGLFVLQHHLQLFQRTVNDKVGEARSLGLSYPWGVLEMNIQEDSLSEGIVAINSLQAIMPSGLRIDVPRSASLEPLRVADALRTMPSGLQIMLAVTNWSPNSPNMEELDVVGKPGSGRWGVDPTEFRDENDGQDPEQILLRKINARLVLENEIPAGAEVMPLLRLHSDHASDSFSVIRDLTHAPPSVLCGASDSIMLLVGELGARLASAREEHLAYLSRGGYDAERLAGQQVEWMLRTQAISSALPRLADGHYVANLTPFELYHELRALLGHLNPLRPEPDLYDVDDYDHADPLPVLSELSLRIRNLVFDAGLGTYLSAQFKAVQTGGDDMQMVAKINDNFFIQGQEFYIAIDTDPQMPGSDTASLVLDSDAFKLLPASQAENRIRGLKLNEERFPPLALPAKPGRIYFAIDRKASATAWARIREEKQVAAVWSKSRREDLSMTFVANTTGAKNG